MEERRHREVKECAVVIQLVSGGAKVYPILLNQSLYF